MAIVLDPLGSGGASGSKGDTTFQLWRGRWMARSRPNPTQPQTTIQVAKQTIMTTVTRSWKDRTEGQRELWKQVAKGQTLNDSLGQQHTPTGYNYYVKTNLIRLGYNAELLEEPLLVEPIWQTDQVISYDPVVELFKVTPVIMAGDPDIIDVWATDPLTQSIQPRVPNWRQVGFSAVDTAVTFIKERKLGYWIRSRWGSLAGANGVFFQDWMFAWAPTVIDSTVVWISAQDVTLIVMDISSMNGIDGMKGYTQAAPTNQPMLVEDVINGLPVARFNGIDDHMTNNTLADQTDGTVMVVGKFVLDATKVLIGGIITSIQTGIRFLSATGIQFKDVAGVININFPAPTDEFHIYCVTWSSGETEVRIDGVSVGTGLGIGTISIKEIFGRFTTQNPAGDCPELIVFDEVLSDDNRQTVEQYLSTKYDISI